MERRILRCTEGLKVWTGLILFFFKYYSFGLLLDRTVEDRQETGNRGQREGE